MICFCYWVAETGHAFYIFTSCVPQVHNLKIFPPISPVIYSFLWLFLLLCKDSGVWLSHFCLFLFLFVGFFVSHLNHICLTCVIVLSSKFFYRFRCLVKSPFLIQSWQSSYGWRKESLLGLFLWILLQFMKALRLWCNHIPESLLIYHYLNGGFSKHEFWRWNYCRDKWWNVF